MILGAESSIVGEYPAVCLQSHQEKVRNIEKRVFQAESSNLRKLVDSEVREMRAMAGLPPEDPPSTRQASPPTSLDLEVTHQELEELTLRQEPSEVIPVKDKEGSSKDEIKSSELLR